MLDITIYQEYNSHINSGKRELHVARKETFMDKRVFGQIGENTAADVLRAKGYRILRQNYRCKYGEIDIIAEKYGDMSFVEVKTRQSFHYGRPAEAVTEEKKKHLRKAAHCYLDEMKGKGYVPRKYGFKIIEIVVNQVDNAF